ncbi:conjugal transfer protein TrbI [Sphingopyxis sp. HIX]|nr:conjugal transfer protein TrbI [Sphingopyxis sp. HIX]KTE85452.1 conjugal transfer protein TrbI [Sphingopyxis sp. HXXIV]
METAVPGAAAPKVDPETLVLRGTPRRAVRFRRKLIIALAVTVSLGIAGAAWIALKPATFRLVALDEERPDKAGGAPEALAKAPGSYDAVPELGPPLPGDLGRAILARQRAEGGLSPGMADAAADDGAAARRQAIEAEAAAARQSGVMMKLAGTARAPAALPVPLAADAAPGVDAVAAPAGVAAGAGVPGGSAGAVDVNPHRIAAAPWLLSSGSVIAASLVTGLNSDVPGLVVAQVTENVHDSITGRVLLIPQGARLVGRYDDRTAFGQRRARVVWQRIIWPDGSSLRMEDVPASDAAGQAGLADSVDLHSGSLFKGVALSTLLGAGTELGFGGEESELVRALRQSAQQNGARAGDRLVDRHLDIPPTIRVRPGWPLRVVVHQDLVLKPWRL